MHTISEFCINNKINVLKFEMKIRTFITIAKLKNIQKQAIKLNHMAGALGESNCGLIV